MERITSKLTRVLVVTLLGAATIATAGSLTLKASSAVLPQAATPIPPKPMCEAWEAARARNSPAAPGLEQQCHAQWAARGVAIENQYPWAAELRSQQPNDSARRGFDIGMAAAEGQTAPGPGKQRLHDALSPAEQEGYSIAVSYSLMWNRNLEKTGIAELAARGAELASADPWAAGLRNQQPDAAARRGFDIGMAAAEGQTAPGPGKQKIHDSLSPDEQEGFRLAVSYSLTKNKNLEKNGNAEAPGGADIVRPRRGSDSRNLRATLEHLRQGREFLEATKPGQDGHREKAIDYINKAIEELEKALTEIP
jgi:hypothetical protein